MKIVDVSFNRGQRVSSIIFLLCIVLSFQVKAQLAKDKGVKFLGGIIPSSIPSTFDTYWNQITPENAGKWGSVESTQIDDVANWNWTDLDRAYNHAKDKGYKFKHHNFIWGSQYPAWLTTLSADDQKIQIEKWMQAVADRYPDIDYIDVVNEPIKTACPFAAALGGSGTTGFDWIVWSFQKARDLFPNAKLLINEYGTENDTNVRNAYKAIIAILKGKGLIDGIGIQCHYFNLDNMTAAQMKTCLDDYATTGLPVYVSELDITGGGVEATQSSKYQELFPVMWNHANVRGITLWGYIEGQTWHAGTGIINSNGTLRSAMTWLKTYMVTAKSFSEDGPITAIEKPVDDDVELNFYPNPTSNGKLTVELPRGATGLNVLDYSGKSIQTWALQGIRKVDIELDVKPGIYLLHVVGLVSKTQKVLVR